MNKVILIGRLTKDPEIKYGAQSQKAFCRMYIALNRGKDRNGEDMGADYPAAICFGKQAENCEKMLRKGSLVSIDGKIRTSKTEINGETRYSTDVFIDHIEYLADYGEKQAQIGFAQDDDIPF